MGDVKMLAMIGAFLGWQLTLVTLMMASLTGTVVGLALIAAGRGTMKYALPFGSFLAARRGDRRHRRPPTPRLVSGLPVTPARQAVAAAVVAAAFGVVLLGVPSCSTVSSVSAPTDAPRGRACWRAVSS